MCNMRFFASRSLRIVLSWFSNDSSSCGGREGGSEGAREGEREGGSEGGGREREGGREGGEGGEGGEGSEGRECEGVRVLEGG